MLCVSIHAGEDKDVLDYVDVYGKDRLMSGYF